MSQHASVDIHPTMRFAREELMRFWPGAEAWEVACEIDATLPDGAFAVTCCAGSIRLRGATPGGVVCAIYTLLERIGIRFEITGPILPEAYALETLNGWQEVIVPAVRVRGIRQHINFPMDISSYSRDEALEYVRNLARMRLTHLTFHSYPFQWIARPQAESHELAGAFFYGVRHDLPDDKFVTRHVRNEHTFCIPEIEPVFDQPEECSRQAVAWLRAVMAEAKRVGMTIQLSWEPRSPSIDVQDTVQACCDIFALYPDIDTLELMTQEIGGWGATTGVETLRTLVCELFGADALAIPEVAALMIEGQCDLHQVFGEVGHNVHTARALRAQAGNGPAISLGVYCAMPQYQSAVLALLHRYAPTGVSFTLLPGHGSERMARYLCNGGFTADDLPRTMLYSWLEFDGLMFLQQNGVPGIHRLLEHIQALDGGLPALGGLAFNHWRTAENRLTARYAAHCTLFGLKPAGDFYQAYAEDLGIGLPETFAAAMTALGNVDHRATEELPNIGFCFVGCWGTTGLGYFGMWRHAIVCEVRDQYAAIAEQVATCLAHTERQAGREMLAFLLNRLHCSCLYLEAMATAVRLQSVCGTRNAEDLTDEERGQVVAICDRALEQLDEYMALHATQLLDRGCEGTLISLYYTPPAVLRRIRHEFGGARKADATIATGNDAPPSPIVFHSLCD